MASSSNIGLARLPWGKLPRSPVAGKKGSNCGGGKLEMSFHDIMEEQKRESSQEKEFEEYIQHSYVTVPPPPTTPVIPPTEAELDKSFLQIDEVDPDLKLVMSFYEDQDFDDATYELSEQELDELQDDDCDKYYEGLAKKLSTVVELQAPSLSVSTKGKSRAKMTQASSLPDSVRLSPSSSTHSNGEDVLDADSTLILEKLKRKGILKGTFKPIYWGSSSVLHATGGMLKRRDETGQCTNTNAILKLRVAKECAIKVFNNSTTTKTDIHPEEEQRLIQAKKEMTHLNRMTRAGIPCPQVQFLHRHVLVTDFVGKEGIPAKRLADAHDIGNSRIARKTAYDQITNNMKTLFKTCHLVHGQLSESKILWHKRKAYFTSVGNAVNAHRTESLELLYRDCVTITEFFENSAVQQLENDYRPPQALFRWITGFDFTGEHVECAEEQGFAIV